MSFTPGDLDGVVRALTRAALWIPAPDDDVDLGVERLLPHRAPFLFVDRVLAADPTEGAAIAIRHVDPHDPVFAGHFPDAPVFPGVLLVEAMGQAGLCALGIRGHAGAPPPDAVPSAVRVTRVHHAAFLAAVLPGDTIRLVARVLEDDGLCARIATQAWRDDTLCAACVMEVYLA